MNIQTHTQAHKHTIKQKQPTNQPTSQTNNQPNKQTNKAPDRRTTGGGVREKWKGRTQRGVWPPVLTSCVAASIRRRVAGRVQPCAVLARSHKALASLRIVLTCMHDWEWRTCAEVQHIEREVGIRLDMRPMCTLCLSTHMIREESVVMMISTANVTINIVMTATAVPAGGISAGVTSPRKRMNDASVFIVKIFDIDTAGVQQCQVPATRRHTLRPQLAPSSHRHAVGDSRLAATPYERCKGQMALGWGCGDRAALPRAQRVRCK